MPGRCCSHARLAGPYRSNALQLGVHWSGPGPARALHPAADHQIIFAQAASGPVGSGGDSCGVVASPAMAGLFLFFTIIAFVCVVPRIPAKKYETDNKLSFMRTLLDYPSEECRHIVAVDQSIAAVILSPQDLHETVGPNITLIGCVKGITIPSQASAFLHVVDGMTHKGSNPIPFSKEICSIEWQDVPPGSFETFIEVLDKNNNEIARSPPVRFSRALQNPQTAGVISHDTDSHLNRRAESRVINHLNFTEEKRVDEWPIFTKLRALSSDNTRSFCGMGGWEAVTAHEVMSVFLQSEWYKEEHAEWRNDSRALAAVMRPNISDDNENILRAMLLATPRKVRAVHRSPQLI